MDPPREIRAGARRVPEGLAWVQEWIVIQSKCGIAEGGSIDDVWPDSLVEPQEVAKAFDELHHTGRVRYFGVSNHTACQIEVLQKHVGLPGLPLVASHW